MMLFGANLFGGSEDPCALLGFGEGKQISGKPGYHDCQEKLEHCKICNITKIVKKLFLQAISMFNIYHYMKSKKSKISILGANHTCNKIFQQSSLEQ